MNDKIIIKNYLNKNSILKPDETLPDSSNEKNINCFYKKNYLDNIYKFLIYFLSFTVPFIIFLKTMNPSSFGYDTTWFHIQVPELAVGQTTGFPLAFLLGKLFSLLPIKTMAYRLNMFSVFWGAATVLVFVMIVSNLLKKQYYIAIVSTLFFAFFKVFWVQTNRFEVYTLHSFLIGLVILFGIYWTQTKKDKFLYLYYLFIGISFTNHPLSIFLAPALILFPIFIDWKAVFKLKKIFIIIALLLSPLLLYLYIPIRSFQGHGNIKTLHSFIDYITGSRWKQQFGFKTFNIFKKQIFNYLSLVKGDFTIISAIISLFGFVMLFIKNKKYFFLIIALIILNLIPIFLYESVANDFYLISIITFLTIPFAYGIYYIKEVIVFIFKKISIKINYKKLNKKENLNVNCPKANIIFLITFFLIITIFPVYLGCVNYPVEDKSKDTMIYDYWKTIITQMKDNSVLITSSKSSQVAFYLVKFEFKKNIQIMIGLNEKKIMEYVKENFGKKNIYFNETNLPPLNAFFELKQIGYEIYWKDYNEILRTWEILGFKKNVDFIASDKVVEMDFGKEKVLYYIIKNPSNSDKLNISSIELKLPNNLKLLEIDASQSDIKDMPGLSRGIYMWTNGPYVIEPSKQIKIAFKIKAAAPGDDNIKFQITTMKVYESAPDIKVIVK